VQSSSSGGGSAPQFNPQDSINAQKGANMETAIANAWLGNTNQVTPYGNLTYTKTGEQTVGGQVVPTFTATQTPSGVQQGIIDRTGDLQTTALDAAKTVAGNVQGAVSTPLNYDGLAELPQNQDQLRNDAYSALTARSFSDLDQREAAQKVQLQNQGIAAGSEAWKRALEPIDRSRIDAGNQATIQAGNVAGQNLSQAQALRGSQITDRTNLRNSPLQDYATLMGFGGGPTSPTYAPPTQATVAPIDATSPFIAQYQGQLQGFNAANSASQGLMGGLFGLGGAALGGWARSGFKGLT
jgi:hypothetical protein